MFIDGEVVLAEVGGFEEDLAHRDAGSEAFGVEESFIDADVVVVGGTVLEGESLASAGGGMEASGAGSYADEGLGGEEVVEMEDPAEGVLVDAGLGSSDDVGGEVLGVAGEGVVALEADHWGFGVADGAEDADGGAAILGDHLLIGRIDSVGAANSLGDDADGGAAELHAVELALEGGFRSLGADRGGADTGDETEAKKEVADRPRARQIQHYG